MKKKNPRKGSNITKIEQLLRPVVESMGLIFWDITLLKLGGSYELTVFIDREGAVSIDDCEAVSRALDPILDREDPIDGSYIFYVSSAGIERTLSKNEHFERYIGHEVTVKLYRAENGVKEHSGKLLSHSDTEVSIQIDESVSVFLLSDVASVKLSYTGNI
ncbi:MAG: ribosome maturation factor RimP [Clostridiales bacterium]|nr:ribosome maturation factor RimP [Clostridiales bacterium]